VALLDLVGRPFEATDRLAKTNVLDLVNRCSITSADLGQAGSET